MYEEYAAYAQTTGLSENIRVISIVDRYLEHSRILAVANGGIDEVYISSADWMTRNLIRRVELMCPVIDIGLRQMLMNLLQMNLQDNVKARELRSTGAYERVHNEDAPLRSQFEAADISIWKSAAALLNRGDHMIRTMSLGVIPQFFLTSLAIVSTSICSTGRRIVGMGS